MMGTVKNYCIGDIVRWLVAMCSKSLGKLGANLFRDIQASHLRYFFRRYINRYRSYIFVAMSNGRLPGFRCQGDN